MVVSLGSTLGLRQSDEQLVAALDRLGFLTHVVTPDLEPWRRRLGRFAFRVPFMDLSEALACRIATGRALRTVRPSLFFYTTTTATLLEPLRRRRGCLLRFDSLTRENRPGRTGAVPRILERLTLRRAHALMPLANASSYADLGHVVPLPPPIVPSPVVPKDADLAMCYANGPKKRLDLVLEAWRISGSAAAGRRLAVAGTSSADFEMQWPGQAVPEGVDLLGRVSAGEFRRLTARAKVYLAAPDHEEFGLAPLEALADGALLVTTRARGNYEALRISADLTPELVAVNGDAHGLGRVLQRAWAIDAAQAEDYRRRGAANLATFDTTTFDHTLRETVAWLLHAGGLRHG